MSEVTDMVNHPPHYKDASGIECIEVTKYMLFCGGSCFKYVYRCGNKWDDIEDLKKAAWYANQSWMLEENVGAIIIPSIKHVARYRSGNIADAMKFIAQDMWADAKRAIEREIARLESENARDQ